MVVAQTGRPVDAAPTGTLAFDEETARKLEIVYSAAELAARRRATLEAVAPQRGERALDIGPGPGFLLCELAEVLGPTGRVDAVDCNPAMLEQSRRRAERLGLIERVGFWGGDATALPLPDEAFDLVICSQVLEYVADVARAVREIRRVLRPGGRFAIMDADWDTFVVQTEDVGLNARLLHAFRGHLAHNSLPRWLGPLLREAGLDNVTVQPRPVANTSRGPETYSHGIVPLVADYVRTRGGLTPSEVDAWLADLDRQEARGAFFLGVTYYLFSGQKPAGFEPESGTR
jgi:ubiquinone/menaquinone biosynthesis C-methylase UbiE